MNKKRRNTLKRAITLMLAVAMVFTSVPASAGSLDANGSDFTVTASTEEVTSVTETEVVKEDSTGVASADQESEDKNEENPDSNADENQEIKEEAQAQAGEKSEDEAQVKAVAFAEGREAEVAPVEITESAVLNVGNDIANGTYTDDFQAGAFVVKAAAESSVVVEDNSKGDYTKRMKMGGSGNLTYRSVQLLVADKANVKLDVMSSSGSADRVVLLLDSEGNTVSETSLAASKDVVTLNISVPEAGTYYIASKESGINIYGITVTVGGNSQGDDSQTGTDTPTGDITVNAEGDIYVAPKATGDGSSKENPTEFTAALKALKPGKTIFMADGTYKYSEMIVIDKDNCGTADAMKSVKAENANKVTLDFSEMGYTGSDADKQNRGVVLDGSYWNFYGINITGAADNGMILSGNNNVLEMCVFFANHDSGLQVSRYRTDCATIDTWPSNNLIKNCTAYDNSDITGENADGFAAKLTCGEGNVFDGCMSYCNSDDGWDLYAKTATGKIGVVTIKNCVSFGNGLLSDGTGSPDGDMNGFKLGSSQGTSTSTPHIVENCVAFGNGAHGFTDNGNQSGIVLKNCTSFNNSAYSGSNCANFQMNRESGGKNSNLLSVATNKIATDGFIGTVTNSIYYNGGKYYEVGDTETFAGKEKIGNIVTVSADDFVSLDVPAYTNNFHEVWRKADGSIDMGTFLAIKETSALANRGLGSSLPSGAVGEATIVPSTPEDKEDDDAQAGTGSETKPSVSGDVHAKTFEDGTFSDDVFTITGNISKDKGTVVYDGQTLTKCLKMESATSIKFTAVSAAKLVMVFNDGETKSIKIDGTNTAINNGTLTVDVAAGAHEITKKDSVNLYYIALVYPKAEPVLPEVEAIPSVDGKVDVYDFGAEQLDTEKYVNKLNADIINSWYPGVEAGTKGKNIASFEVKDENDKTVLAFNDGGFPAAHRLRSTNTAITRYDEKSLKNAAGEVAYQGYIYSNKGSTADVNVQVYLEKNDKVTFAVASNGKDSNLGFRAPSGTVDSGYTHTAGSGTASEVTYYAAETGLYTLYSISEKLVVARVMVEHPQDVNVVGLVEAPEALSDYKIAFTCKETGEVIETTPVDGAYNTVLVNGFNYEVSLVGANEYVVTSSKDIKVDGGENNYVQQNIKIDGVKLVTCDVNFVGIPEGALESLDLKFEADSVYAPVIKDGTITLEVGVEYVLTAEGVDDYELTTHTLKASKTLSEAEISFEKKPVYKITIAPNVATVDDLANAKFTFTRHSDADITAEEGYVYRFTGVEGIQLRDGIYTVKVEAEGFTQKLTSNLKVDGADVTKQISFISNNENAPKTWVFTGEDYTGQAQYNGLQIVNGKKHGSQYGMLLGTNGAITIPVSGPSTIKVGVGYSWDLTLGDENYNKPGDAGVDTVEFGYTGAAGIVVIKSSLNGLSSYISSITVIPVTDEEVAIPSSWDFRTDAYTGQADFNGLSIVNGGKHGAQYGMKNTNGSIKVPVKGACDIKVAVGYNWDVTIDGFQGEKYKDKTNGGDITLEYSYTGEAGTVEITTGSEFTSYIKSIELVYPSTGAEDVVLKVGANEKYKTINAALDAVRTMNREAGQRAVIEIQPGDYEEMLVVDVKDVTLKNASATPSTAILNKGVDIDANAVRITSYYGHGYTYYSMGKDCKYDDEILAVNRENGYPSFENPGSGTTAGSYWNATVCIAADGFNAEGIIFENSFNQYVSKKAANDIIVKQSTAKEGATPRAQLPVGSTEVQNKKYVERAAALAMYNNVKQANFDNCKFIGRQDTLYGGTNTTAAFYDCDIYGGTDYIFGGMTAVFAKCNLVANTMEDSNDTFYITAAQQKEGRGYLMYNCNVTSTVPGVDTASVQTSKAGYLGRPWQATTSEVVFYATVIDATADETSMISPKGWLSTLSGTSDNVYEFGSYEMMAGVDNTAARESWAKTFASIEGATLADGTAVSVAAFLGDWDPFTGKDMDVVYPDGKVEPAPVEPEEPQPSATTEFTLESKNLTAFAAGAKADGTEEKAGTEDYFTILYSAKSKVDSSSKDFEDGYSSGQRINLGGKATTAMNSVKFTTENPATVKVWWAEGGEDNRQMALLNTAGEIVVKTDETLAKNGPCISTLKLENAGTYFLGGDINNNYIFKIVVTEEVPAAPVVNTYVIDSTADLTAFAAGAKANGTEEKAGTNNFFTMIYSAKSKVDGSSKAFEDGYSATQRINFGGKVTTSMNSVKFTTEGTAEVKVWWAEGGEDNRQMAILDASGNQVAITEGTYTKNDPYISKFTLNNPGTYYLGGATNNNYIFKIEVTDTVGGAVVKPARADWATVAAPVITSAVDNGEGTLNVTVAAEIGYDGADEVSVTMTDAEGKTTSKKSSKEGSEVTLSFAPSASGAYTFTATAVRENETAKASDTVSAEFILPLQVPVLVSVTSKGEGKVEVVWNAVPEATAYRVYAQKKGAVAALISLFTTADYVEVKDATSVMLEGLEVGAEYEITVTAVRGEEETAKQTGKGILTVKVTEASQRTWAFAAYGSSTNTANNGYEGSALDGKVTVYSENGKGKIVPGSTDGIAYYYTKIDPEKENFTFTADIHVDNWTLSNGQEGFGIMVSDTVGKHGDGTAFWNNGYQAIATKVEYYHDGQNVTTDTTANKITMKLGLGVLARNGVTAQDVADIAAGKITMPAGFVTNNAADTLESSCAVNGAGTYNLIGNYSDPEPTGTVANPITDFKMSIQRNNTGYIITYMDLEGNVLGSKKYYDLERTALTQIDPDNIYVGIFASRNARITASNITLTTIDPVEDAPAEERVIEKVIPQYGVTSSTTANVAAYNLVFRGNADGVLKVSGAATAEVAVKANEDAVIPATLTYGNNKFDLVFTPDETFVPGDYQVMENFEVANISHTVLYKNYGAEGDSLYVSPKGSANGNGTKANPLDIYTAVKYVQPGQTIVITEGTYKLSKTVKVERGTNGTAEKKIQMVADPAASSRPVFDFQSRCAGMVLAGDYWYFRGFDVTKSADGQKGIQVSGNNNTLDQINTYMNGNTGLQISRYLGTDGFDKWPANNLILNCTSYLNADKGYEDADGFAAKLTVGNGNVFDGCVAHHNADDGWDLFAKVQSGSIGAVTIQNCVAYKNGIVLTVDGQKYSQLAFDGAETDAGNGNGFKMGGDSMPGHHVLKNSIAFDNKAKGVDSNSCPDIQVYNTVSYNNGSYNVAFYTNTAVNTDFFADGLISYRKGTNVEEQFKEKGTQDKSKIYGETNFYWDKATEVSSNSKGDKVSDDWFKSLEFTGISRNADGTINMNGFLELTEAAKAGASIGGTSSETVVPGEETDGTVEGNVPEPTVNTEPTVTPQPTETPSVPATPTTESESVWDRVGENIYEDLSNIISELPGPVRELAMNILNSIFGVRQTPQTTAPAQTTTRRNNTLSAASPAAGNTQTGTDQTVNNTQTDANAGTTVIADEQTPLAGGDATVAETPQVSDIVSADVQPTEVKATNPVAKVFSNIGKALSSVFTAIVNFFKGLFGR